MSDPIFNEQKCDFELKRKASYSRLEKERLGQVVDQGSHGPNHEVINRIEKEMSKMPPGDTASIQKNIVQHLEYSMARSSSNVENDSFYRAASLTVRDRLVALLNTTNKYFAKKNPKRIYYLSLEFLIGRAMQNCLVNLDLEESYRKAVSELGYDLERLYEEEHDAALGNGGLGRLAACFLDSMATMNLPAWGYGIRYKYGIFSQKIVKGWQVEYPDYWLSQGNPWEIKRYDVTYAVRFGGNVEQYTDVKGNVKRRWVGGTVVQAIAYDNPIVGFETLNCVNLRLWSALPSKELDLVSFNKGNFFEAIHERNAADTISAVLYPNDQTEQGKELRLKQQYLFCCATVQDVLRKFKKIQNCCWEKLPEYVAMQLNDTHPTIAIPELIRILVDIEDVAWEKAVEIAYNVFSYTNHTVLPEALERWNVNLLTRLLPRHIEIIYKMNHCILTNVRRLYGEDVQRLQAMSVIEEGNCRYVRMANLGVIGCHKVNGVAALHSQLVKKVLFPAYVDYYERTGQPNKFINITNGVTIRRWIHNSNRELSCLITKTLGSDGWIKNMSLVEGIYHYANDEDFKKQWALIKHHNKIRLSDYITRAGGPKLDPNMFLDVQVKRIHEYKRQQLNVFYILYRYLKMKKMSLADRLKMVPRYSIIGGKAAPGYYTAKTIIRLINAAADLINSDPEISPYFRVFFLPDYNVSSASLVIPASDINQQISTAGMEASGTSNMKFVMNGSLIVGSMDGATVEIVEEAGLETAFIFGATVDQINPIRDQIRCGNLCIDDRLSEVFTLIKSGSLSCGDEEAQGRFNAYIDQLLVCGNGNIGDYYLCINDFPNYIDAQERAEALYLDQSAWWSLSIKAAARMAKFSSDRTVLEYADKIWNCKPCQVILND